MIIRCIDVVCGEPELSGKQALDAVRLARAMVETVREQTVGYPASRERFEVAFALMIDRAARFSTFPEYAILIADDAHND
jgi:hypothetical protein